MKTPVSSMLLVFAGSFIGSFGAVFLKSASAHLKFTISGMVSNYRMILGIVFYLVSSCFYGLGVRQGELTILYPMVSLGYIWTLLWAKLFFQEPLTRNKFAGLGFILLGIVFIGLGNR